MELVDGGHIEFWYLDSSKYKNYARNGFSMPKLVGKVVLHSFWYQFVFKLHFQYGHRRPFWILPSHKFRRHFRKGHGGKIFSKYVKELKSSVKPYYALSGHGTPRLHPTNCRMASYMYIWRQIFQLSIIDFVVITRMICDLFACSWKHQSVCMGSSNGIKIIALKNYYLSYTFHVVICIHTAYI